MTIPPMATTQVGRADYVTAEERLRPMDFGNFKQQMIRLDGITRSAQRGVEKSHQRTARFIFSPDVLWSFADEQETRFLCSELFAGRVLLH